MNGWQIKKAVKNMVNIFMKKTGGQIHTVQRNFSLESGERQTGKTIEEIRYDHRARYDFAIKYLKEHYPREKAPFGLDAFCGTGYGTYMLSNGLACNMLGIDASRDAIALANSHYANEQTFYVHKIFPFSLPETAFDFITCYESLEHVGKAPLLVKELGTSLKRDGCLFLSVPNEPCLPLSKNPNPFHCKHYSMQEIMSMVSELTDLELLMWLGQNLYEVCDGKVCGSLPEDKMELLESQEGQLLVCVFRKR